MQPNPLIFAVDGIFFFSFLFISLYFFSSFPWNHKLMCWTENWQKSILTHQYFAYNFFEKCFSPSRIGSFSSFHFFLSFLGYGTNRWDVNSTETEIFVPTNLRMKERKGNLRKLIEETHIKKTTAHHWKGIEMRKKKKKNEWKYASLL